MKLQELLHFLSEEEKDDTISLYHGTCRSSAESILQNGWQPGSGESGANVGQSKYLYLTTEKEDAEWFANEKGCSSVIKVEAPMESLIPDPEDSTHDSVEEELQSARKIGTPAKLALYKSLPAKAFSAVSLNEETLGRKGGAQYYQMGSSLSDEFYNVTDEGEPTRDPGIAGFEKEGEDSGKELDKEREGKQAKGKDWYKTETHDRAGIHTLIEYLNGGVVKPHKRKINEQIKPLDKGSFDDYEDYLSKLLDLFPDQFSELDNYIPLENVDVEYVVIPASSKSDLKFWLEDKLEKEGPVDEEHVDEIGQEGEIKKPVILDTRNDHTVDGRHRLAAAIKYDLDVPALLILEQGTLENDFLEESVSSFSMLIKRPLKEFSAVSTAAIEAFSVESDIWDSEEEPRINSDSIRKNREYVRNLDVTGVQDDDRGLEVFVDKMDPQYKRQIEMIKNPDDVPERKEPVYNEPSGEHRIADLGYTKLADREGVAGEIYLYPYDPNWKRSEDMVQQSVKHWVDNHSNRGRLFPDANADMYVSVKEDTMFHNVKLKDVFQEELEQPEEDLNYYHGTNMELSVGERILPPEQTGNVAEKGRKKKLDKVFITQDKKYAKIYAGRAVQAGGGEPHVYQVAPKGELETIQKQKGARVLAAPAAEVVREVEV